MAVLDVGSAYTKSRLLTSSSTILYMLHHNLEIIIIAGL